MVSEEEQRNIERQRALDRLASTPSSDHYPSPSASFEAFSDGVDHPSSHHSNHADTTNVNATGVPTSQHSSIAKSYNSGTSSSTPLENSQSDLSSKDSILDSDDSPVLVGSTSKTEKLLNRGFSLFQERSGAIRPYSEANSTRSLEDDDYLDSPQTIGVPSIYRRGLDPPPQPSKLRTVQNSAPGPPCGPPPHIHKDPVYVARKDRRGLFASLCLVAEVEEPKDLPNKQKWYITSTISLAAAAAPLGSAIILPALMDITRDLHTTMTVTNLSIAFFMLSMAIFPLWWSSFSETLGRRSIYIVSFALFIVFNVLSALSVNITMFIVTRCLAGGAGASVQSVGAGTIADIWEPQVRGKAMGRFLLGPLCGPLLAPILGGVLAQYLGWRSCLWSQAIFGLICWLALIAFLPETVKSRKPIAKPAATEVDAEEGNAPANPAAVSEKGGLQLTRTSTRQSVTIKTKSWVSVMRRVLWDPLKIVLLLGRLPILITVYYGAITFAAMYILNISIQQTFALRPYSYPTTIIGLLYIPGSVGFFLGAPFGGKWVDYIMIREAKKANRYDVKGNPIYRPEDRMKENVWVSGMLYPAALVWYGWTAYKGEPAPAVLVSCFFFGVGAMMLNGTLATMLTEFMPKYQIAHGMACYNLVRNVAACVATVVAEPLLLAVHNAWLFTAIGAWCMLSGAMVILIMGRFASQWRAKELAKAKPPPGMGPGGPPGGMRGPPGSGPGGPPIGRSRCPLGLGPKCSPKVSPKGPPGGMPMSAGPGPESPHEGMRGPPVSRPQSLSGGMPGPLAAGPRSPSRGRQPGPRGPPSSPGKGR